MKAHQLQPPPKKVEHHQRPALGFAGVIADLQHGDVEGDVNERLRHGKPRRGEQTQAAVRGHGRRVGDALGLG